MVITSSDLDRKLLTGFTREELEIHLLRAKILKRIHVQASKRLGFQDYGLDPNKNFLGNT